MESKLDLLKTNIKALESLVVAFSGGVDSTFLLAVAKEVLGDNLLAATAVSPTFPSRELKECIGLAEKLQVKQILINIDQLQIRNFADNPPNRCYLCKLQLFEKILELVNSNGFKFAADGSNKDDMNDYRPGMKALKELGIISPLLEAGLDKREIRLLSKRMGLATWNKPAAACLSSRFVYGEKITAQKLNMVDEAEAFLEEYGLEQVRVRMHRDLARIEVGPDERHVLSEETVMDQIYQRLRQLGFRYVTLDMQGYRTGSMNEGQILPN